MLVCAAPLVSSCGKSESSGEESADLGLALQMKIVSSGSVARDVIRFIDAGDYDKAREIAKLSLGSIEKELEIVAPALETSVSEMKDEFPSVRKLIEYSQALDGAGGSSKSQGVEEQDPRSYKQKGRVILPTSGES